MNLKEEKRIWKRGYKRVFGLDEAGRGPLSGPVVAAAVSIKPDFHIPKELKDVKDSKQLSFGKREELYKAIVKNPNLKYGIGRVSPRMIDKINILQATKLAMEKAVKDIKPDFLIIDGNFRIGLNVSQKSIIKGDQKVFSIAVASIIAKVSRDRMMIKYHKKYPQYGFNKHKGYSTELHRKMIKKCGPCRIHRKTFAPVRRILTEKF